MEPGSEAGPDSKVFDPPTPSISKFVLPPGLPLSYFLHLLSITVALDTKFILHPLLC